ncbi:hypothetical protein I552_6940 [Mycobacterium xenopi 3993]|nr:hypothetical protein I552_6940 [Mycobacterium xenopi 3993]
MGGVELAGRVMRLLRWIRVWARAMRGRALKRPVGVSPWLSLTRLPLDGFGNRLWA